MQSGFLGHTRGSAAPLFALAIVPLMAGITAALDYSRANGTKARLQASLDSALLAGARDGTDNWIQLAQQTFSGNFPDATAEAVFSAGTGGSLLGTATVDVATTFSFFGISEVKVAVQGAATGKENPEQSCVLAYDKSRSIDSDGVSFGGAPNVKLAGCAIRSNTSVNCSGHDGAATATIAAGSASNCSNPQINATAVPDIYAKLAKNISKLCGSSRAGVSWQAGTVPASGLIKAGSAFHVCGDLTLSGSGSLMDGPTSDMSIVVENGRVILANNASISAERTTIILSGNYSYPSNVSFPNGNGQSATLSISPPTSTDNPWRGVALYQDPALTTNVDNDWGPGTTFAADGLIYLPNSRVSMRGVASSGHYRCTKFAVNTFATNGSVALDFEQTSAGCDTIGLNQWAPVRLTR